MTNRKFMRASVRLKAGAALDALDKLEEWIPELIVALSSRGVFGEKEARVDALALCNIIRSGLIDVANHPD